ncbi:MAG TPA: hypothetical protein VNR51_12065 [Hyphomicrobium sp.]|nr:hypothetical protein [Hyphomicrobium sp.]
MLVVQRNGQTTIISGWKAWLMGLGLVLSAIAGFVLLAFLLIGIAITIGALLLVIVPAAIALTLLGAVRRRQP